MKKKEESVEIPVELESNDTNEPSLEPPSKRYKRAFCHLCPKSQEKTSTFCNFLAKKPVKISQVYL